jgi:glycosyltransferase 2 family protein
VVPALARGVSGLGELARQPGRLAPGLFGALLMTAAYSLALWLSVQAFRGDAPLAAVTVVYLAGNAIGSAAPTPGGVGAVEAALIAGLTAAGVPAASAVPAVLLFRVATFWLPALPGWWAFTSLQRSAAL